MSRGVFATINFRTSSSGLSNALRIPRGLRINPSKQDNTIGEILECSHDRLSAARIVGHIWQSLPVPGIYQYGIFWAPSPAARDAGPQGFQVL